MNYVKALLFKFAMTLLALSVILTGFFSWRFQDVLLTSIVLTILGYLGDLFIFRNIGNDRKLNSDHTKRNMIGTAADVPVAFLIIWLMGQMLNAGSGSLIAEALIASLAIAAGEWFLHRYLDKHVFSEKRVT